MPPHAPFASASVRPRPGAAVARVLFAVLCLGALGAARGTAAGATPVYEVLELRSLSPDGGVQVGGMNGKGDLAGTSFGPEATFAEDHVLAVRWEAGRRGVPTALGLGFTTFAVATAIAPSGEIGGSLITDERTFAALWGAGGVPQVLPDPPSIPGVVRGPSTFLNAVRGPGEATGVAQFGVLDQQGRCCTTRTHAVLWSGGSAVLLPGLGGSSSSSVDVNAAGVIVGTAITPTFQVRGVVWESGVLARLLSPLPGHTRSTAEAVNDGGEVVGTSGAVRAVRWPAGATAPIALPLLPGGSFSQALEVNNAGWIAGAVRDASFRWRAVLWLDGQTVVDLNQTIPTASGWELELATEVNDAGWIAGTGRFQGRQAGFLLRPVARRPLVVVPGIMGSSLLREQPGPDDLLWLDLNQALVSADDAFLNDLALDVVGRSVAPIRVGEIFDSFPPANVYGGLLDFLEQAGYQRGVTLFAFPYDWRLGNDLGAQALADFIEQVVLPASGDQEVDLIAHSMGGLVARRLAQLRPDLVERAIYLGTPHQGAPEAFTGLAFDGALLNNFLAIPAVNRHTVAGLAATFPSIYQLLPRAPFIFSLDHGSYLTLAESYTTSYLRSDRWVADAERFHASLAAPPAVEQLQVVGTGVPTLGELVELTDPLTGARDWVPLTANGDGTVPQGSALSVPGAVQSLFVGGVGHQDLPGDPCVHQVLARILDDDLQNLPSCAASQPLPLQGWVRWYSGSPVRITVRDGDGRLDGQLADGGVAEQIPASSFFVLGDNEGGFLPAGEEYQVDLLARDTGVFSLTFVDEGDAGVVTAFVGVPVAAGARGSVVLPPDGTPAALNLDIDGDGTGDLTLSPGPVAPGAALELLRRALDALAMPQGIRQSLLAKVEAATRAVARGDGEAARNVLAALLHELAAQAGKHLTAADARGLESIVRSVLRRL